ncbi:MAG: DUF167 domain-containing protein [Polyangiaceae bacterium]|nr:DUF167 domain-containing protein [Polyangiaceae bacterium]
MSVRVRPRASHPGVRVAADQSVEVAVSAPPVDGAANAEITRLIAHWLGVAPTRVDVWRGQHSRTKVLRIAALAPAELARRLAREAP